MTHRNIPKFTLLSFISLVLLSACREMLPDEHGGSEQLRSPLSQTVCRLKITPSIGTRTQYDPATGSVDWISGDELAVIFATVGGGLDDAVVGTATAQVDGGETVLNAVFPVESLPAAPEGWQLFALYPKSAYVGCAEGRILCRLTGVQTADDNGVYDTKAALLRGETAVLTGSADDYDRLMMRFDHVAGYGEFTIAPPSDAALPETCNGLRIKAEQPLCGDIALTADGGVEVVNGECELFVRTSSFAGPTMFAALPCELSDSDLSVALDYDDGLCVKTLHPSELRFRAGRISAYTPDLGDGRIIAKEGAVLWSETFDGAEPAGSTAAVKKGQITGDYDPTDKDSSCRTFWGATSESFAYSGSYGKYVTYNFESSSLSDVVYTTQNDKESCFAVSGIGLYGASRVRLTFGTTARTAKIAVAFDGGDFSDKTDIEYEDEGYSHCDIEVPQGASELSFEIYGNTTAVRYFDNFELTVSACAEY